MFTMRRSEATSRPARRSQIPGLACYRELLQRILSQGLSNKQLALAVAIGATIGILPTVWGTSILCFIIAFFLRINQVVIQAANYLVYPLQVAFFIPFSTFGQALFPTTFHEATALTSNIFTYDWSNFDSGLWDLQLSALTGWSVLAMPCIVTTYLIILLLNQLFIKR
jgi:uncharacterized protein (DUF2062 family)